MLLMFNFCILQWTGYRLARVIDLETDKQIGWTLVKFPILSGWKFLI